MKNIKILLYTLLITFAYSNIDNVNLTLDIVNSGKYSLSSFVSPDINLWTVYVDVDCNNCTNSRDLRLQVKLIKDNTTVIWGVTKPYEVTNESDSFSIQNTTFVGTQLAAYEQDASFINDVQSSGVLSAGEYRLEVSAHDFGLFSEVSSNDASLGNISGVNAVIANGASATVEGALNNLNIPEQIILLGPGSPAGGDPTSIFSANPTFNWFSPGFGTPSNPINVQYRIVVALFNPELHSSFLDALDDQTNIYFDSGWGITSLETGVAQQISTTYSSDRALSCGYQYCWKVQAREVDVFSSSGQGIWGWPEPAISDIYSFAYGSASISDNSINSPGSYINTVRPIFSFTDEGSYCANSYEIWLGEADDPDIDNPIFKSDPFSGSYQYPGSANGLSPGKTYYWKMRINPDSEPGPWSSSFPFTINSISYSSPSSGEVINTLFPSFNISAPSDINQYQLLISDNNDPEVNQYNVLDQNYNFAPFDFPLNNDIVLNPGETYYWKVQAIDENGNSTELISDNMNISYFSVKPIELSMPSNQSYDISLDPLFSWSGPIGVNSYLIEFTMEYDPNFDNIIFSANTSSAFFLPGNSSSAVPFENGTTYLWRVKPINNNGEEGDPSNHFSFSTVLDNSDLTTLSSETSTELVDLEFNVSLSGVEGKDINVSIITEVEEADTYLIKLSKTPDMDNIIEEIYLQGSLNHSFSGEYLEWNEDYYIQVIAFSNQEIIIGEPSNIEMIILPVEPGSQDRVSFSIELIFNMSPSLIISIIDPVENATDYILRLSENSDMSNFLFSELIGNGNQYTYQNSDGELDFGQTFYFQMIPLKDGQLYGLSSDINSIFIPNVTPPQLTDTEFYWEHSTPNASSYLIEISTTEDFAVILYSNTSQGTNINVNNDIFEDGTGYYWRIRGLDDEGSFLGIYSNPKYFITEGEMVEIEEQQDIDESELVVVVLQNPINNAMVSTKYPNFEWDSIEEADKYEIIVSKNEELSDIVWNSQNIVNNSTIYPSSGAESLEYDVSYYWSVRPIANNIALGNFSNPFSFTISSNLIPEAIGPVENSENIKPYFSWTKVQNAVKYGLIISENSDYSSIIYNNQDITDNIFQYPDDAPNLLYKTEYFWKVAAISEDNVLLGDYSSSTSFRTPSGIVKLEFIFK